jgi:hypothetical protein
MYGPNRIPSLILSIFEIFHMAEDCTHVHIP